LTLKLRNEEKPLTLASTASDREAERKALLGEVGAYSQPTVGANGDTAMDVTPAQAVWDASGSETKKVVYQSVWDTSENTTISEEELQFQPFKPFKSDLSA
jgi:hypothetical protein